MGAFNPGVSSMAGNYSTGMLSSAATASFSPETPIIMGVSAHPGITQASAQTGNVPAPMHGGGGYLVPKVKTVAELLSEFDNLSHKDYLAFKNKLIAAGYASDSYGPSDIRRVYQSLLSDVYDMQGAGAQLTPTAYLNNLIRMNGFDPHKVGSGSTVGSSQPKTWTNTSNSVYDLTPDNARATLRQALQAKLGRDPTEAEIRDFIDAAQTRAADNPSTSTTTYHTDASGNTTSNTTTQAGFSDARLQEMALRRARQAPDYAKYQAASTYYPALVSALGATVS